MHSRRVFAHMHLVGVAIVHGVVECGVASDIGGCNVGPQLAQLDQHLRLVRHDRQTHRDTETQTHRETETHSLTSISGWSATIVSITDAETHTERLTQTHKHTDTQTQRHRHRHRHTWYAKIVSIKGVHPA